MGIQARPRNRDAAPPPEYFIGHARELRQDQPVLAEAAALQAGCLAFNQGAGRNDCPFDAAEPELREAWLWMFDTCTHAMAARMAAISAALARAARAFQN